MCCLSPVLSLCHYIDIINILLLYKSFFYLSRARSGLSLYCKGQALVIFTLHMSVCHFIKGAPCSNEMSINVSHNL